MRRAWKVGIVAIVTAFACASGAAAQTTSPYHHKVKPHRAYAHGTLHAGVAYAPGAYVASRGRGHHFADLVGDPYSGYGFYPLPLKYRVGAWRYRVTHQASPLDNPVLFAIATDAAGYHGWVPGEWGHAHDMFNPIDGVGTPFFAGYYGPAGDDDERAFPFGRPYSR